MQWRKLGLVYRPEGDQAWAQAHAMLPTPLLLADDTLRLYLAHTDGGGVSRIGFIDVSLGDPTCVLRSADEPLLDIGIPGAFDDNGVNASCAVFVGDEVRLYYVGYQLQRKVPYTLFSGLATSRNPDGPFQRTTSTPILDRANEEMFFRTAPFVMHENGRWRMWYIGGSAWTNAGGRTQPTYSVRHIESSDGLAWNTKSAECIAPTGADEIGFGRPFVIKNGGQYWMWYSVRSIHRYTLGYAVSPDGIVWERKDAEVGISLSEGGWDSEMQCYCAIVPGRSKWLMFYNGNGYGRTGVGVAELVT